MAKKKPAGRGRRSAAERLDKVLAELLQPDLTRSTYLSQFSAAEQKILFRLRAERQGADNPPSAAVLSKRLTKLFRKPVKEQGLRIFLRDDGTRFVDPEGGPRNGKKS